MYQYHGGFNFKHKKRSLFALWRPDAVAIRGRYHGCCRGFGSGIRVPGMTRCHPVLLAFAKKGPVPSFIKGVHSKSILSNFFSLGKESAYGGIHRESVFGALIPTANLLGVK